MLVRSARVVLVVSLLCAFALRLINLTVQPLWFDEGWSVWFAASDLPTMAAATARDIHPPLYYALLHGWIALAGHGEFALRLLSALIGVVSVALIYKLADGLFDDKRVSGLAGLLVAIAPLQIFYAQEIRMYGLVTLLGLVSSWLFWKATQREIRGNEGNKGKWWIAYIVATSMTMYTEYYGAFIPLFHFVFLILTTRRPRALLFPLISFIALFLLYLPWLLYAVPELVKYIGDKVGIEQYTSLTLLDYLTRHLIAFSVGRLAADVAWLGWATVIFGALAAWGVTCQVSNVRCQVSHPTIFLLCYLIVPLIAGYLIQLRFPFAPPRMERLLLLASPPFLILVANGVVNLKFKVLNLKLEPLTATAALIIIFIASSVSLFSFYTVARYPEQDYRALANRINALALPSDVMMCVHPWQVGFLQAYLSVPVSLQLVADPAWGAADQAQLDAALHADRRVWLPAYQTLGRILETEMEKYLTENALPVEAKWYETTRLSFYAAAPQFMGHDDNPYRPRLLSIAEHIPQPAGWGIIPLKVLVPSPSSTLHPFNMSVRLKDSQGRIWALQDRPFNPYAEASPINSLLFSDSFGFLIPAGTPPGDYQISITLYDARTQQAIGDDIALNAIRVTAPSPPPPIAALPIQTPLVADWPDARLLGYSLRDGAWQAGDALHLDLFWQARAHGKADDLMFAQLQDASGKPLAIDESAAAYPTAQWARGDLMREQRELHLPASLASGRYRLVVGWLRASDYARVRLANGSDQLMLREIEVVARPHQFNPPVAQTNQNIRFADVARIVGSDFALDAQTNSVSVKLYWQAQREMDVSYKVFVHLIAPDGKTQIAQHDSPPANGNLPTTGWVSGEYIADAHAIPLPPNAPAGIYRVRVGLYDPQSGARVPAFAADGHEVTDDAAELLRFELQ